jgi:hypothetical protein
MRRAVNTLLLALLLAGGPALGVPLPSTQEPEEAVDQSTDESVAEAEAESDEGGKTGRTKQERQERRQERKARRADTESTADTEAAEGEDGAEAEERSGDPDDEAADGEQEGDQQESEPEEEEDEDSDSGSDDDGGSDSDSGSDDDGASDSDDESGSDSDSSSDDDSDSDSDYPAELVITTDAPCHVYVDGLSEGVLEPGETLEVGVDLGEIAVRASAVEATRAVWEKTLTYEEEGQVETIRLRMKKAVRKMRAEERQTGVFRDRGTSLMWMRRDNGRDVDLRDAYKFCRDLDVGGYDGWRLPTLEELRTLEAMWERAAYKIHGDITLSECCMWSTDYDGSEKAWILNFRFRKPFETNAGYKLGLRALCVREWDPELEAEAAAEEAGDELDVLDGVDADTEPAQEENDGGV